MAVTHFKQPVSGGCSYNYMCYFWVQTMQLQTKPICRHPMWHQQVWTPIVCTGSCLKAFFISQCIEVQLKMKCIAGRKKNHLFSFWPKPASVVLKPLLIHSQGTIDPGYNNHHLMLTVKKIKDHWSPGKTLLDFFFFVIQYHELSLTPWAVSNVP